MKTHAPVLLLSIAMALSSAAPVAIGQASTKTVPLEAPELTPEQRQKYAKARDTVARDPEFIAAVKRVEQAQRDLEKMLYVKLAQAAPELSDYIRYQQQQSQAAQSSAAAP